MAEGILRQMLRRSGYDVYVRVLSAGTAACPGSPAVPQAVVAAAEHGVDLSDHRSRAVDGQLLAQADLVLGISPEHVEYVQTIAGAESGATTLKEFAAEGGRGLDVYIPDPIGGSLTMYRASFREIRHEIERVCPAIVRQIDRKRCDCSGQRAKS